MIKCKDHKDIEYDSLTDMCAAYGQNISTVKSRLKNNWSLKDALEKTPDSSSGSRIQVTDHLGNNFSSISDMCKHYNITLDRYSRRIKAGWTKERALTEKVSRTPRAHMIERVSVSCNDHLGNSFNSISEMCNNYHISISCFDSRIKNGWSLERALTEEVTHSIRPNRVAKQSVACQDHLGNKYNSIKEMCAHYNLPVARYYHRKKANWPLERILCDTEGESYKKQFEVVDHLGNTYPSQTAMCEHYNVPNARFQKRIAANWTLKDALTKPGVNTSTVTYDHLGNKYKSLSEMAKAYNMNPRLLKDRLERNWSVKDALTLSKEESMLHRLGHTVCDHKGNVFQSMADMAKAYNMNSEVLYRRLRNNMSLKEALTLPVENRHSAEPSTDHKGNIYPSFVDMCRAYNINNANMVRNRLENGIPLELALTMPSQNELKAKFNISYKNCFKHNDDFVYLCKCKTCKHNYMFTMLQMNDHSIKCNK